MTTPSVDKKRCLDLMEAWSPHSVYFPHVIAKDLEGCGVPVTVLADGTGVSVGGVVVKVIEPEWGEPGIAPIQVVAALAQLTIGRVPDTRMTGRGFAYRDVCQKLAHEWGCERNFL